MSFRTKPISRRGQELALDVSDEVAAHLCIVPTIRAPSSSLVQVFCLSLCRWQHKNRHVGLAANCWRVPDPPLVKQRSLGQKRHNDPGLKPQENARTGVKGHRECTDLQYTKAKTHRPHMQLNTWGRCTCRSQ